MFVTIRLFARLREIAGASELERTLPDGATAGAAWNALVGEFPALKDYGAAVSCAVNEEYTKLTATLEDGDEVAFLPPVSGGALERLPEPEDETVRVKARGRNGPPEGGHYE
jgi:molybdopterin converting factor subunit 1